MHAAFVVHLIDLIILTVTCKTRSNNCEAAYRLIASTAFLLVDETKFHVDINEN